MEIYFKHIFWRSVLVSTAEQEQTGDDLPSSHDIARSHTIQVEASHSPSLARRSSWPPKLPSKLGLARPSWATIVQRPIEFQRLVIWYTLVFRMICWLILHDFDKSDLQLPMSDTMGSRQPVFIV